MSKSITQTINKLRRTLHVIITNVVETQETSPAFRVDILEDTELGAWCPMYTLGTISSKEAESLAAITSSIDFRVNQTLLGGFPDMEIPDDFSDEERYKIHQIVMFDARS